MKLQLLENGKTRPIESPSYVQSYQLRSLMECIARLIPQEGVDYDVVVTFKGERDPSVSMTIDSHTDKGDFWKKYVMDMIGKYPPTDVVPGVPIPDTGDVKDEKDMS